MALAPWERALHSRSLVGDRRFFDPRLFAWTRTLEDEWRTIREDLDAVLRHEDCIPGYVELSDDARNLADRAGWKSFVFEAYGAKVAANRERLPRTTALLDQIPGLKSAFFSILQPGVHLPPHRGHWAGILRCHLGLRIPDCEACGIRVGDEVAHWREGESLVFDDTFEHEAWNRSNGLRAVLFIDFTRPLPQPWAAFNLLAIWLVSRSSVVQPGLERLKAWESRLARVWPRRAVAGAPR